MQRLRTRLVVIGLVAASFACGSSYGSATGDTTQPPAPEPPTTPGSAAPTSPPSGPTNASPGAAPKDDGGPIYGLVDVYEDETLRISSLSANAGFAIAHEVDVDVQPNDVLRVSGQVEVTNDFALPVTATLRLRADGNAAGNMPSENAVVTASHHMPLWVDAAIPCSAAAHRRLGLEIAAARGDASPTIAIESGYGHLVVEHYRKFTSHAALTAAGARTIALVASDRALRATTFGGSFATRALPFEANAAVVAGDIVRLSGSSTSRTPNGEMHGLGLFMGTTLLGAWASKNGLAETPDIPLTVDAIDRPAKSGTRAYTVSMHGVFDHGGAIVSGGGGLDVLTFRKGVSVGSRAPAAFVMTPGKALTITANAPASTVVLADLGALDSGTPVRIAAHVTAAPTSSPAQGIYCVLTSFVESDGKKTFAPNAGEYVTSDMASVALVLRSVVPTAAAGNGVVHATVACSREGSSPTLALSQAVVVAEPLVSATK
jgi:hypothetical protein